MTKVKVEEETYKMGWMLKSKKTTKQVMCPDKLQERSQLEFIVCKKIGFEFSIRIVIFKINASIKLASRQEFKKICHLVCAVHYSKNIQTGEFWE